MRITLKNFIAGSCLLLLGLSMGCESCQKKPSPSDEGTRTAREDTPPLVTQAMFDKVEAEFKRTKSKTFTFLRSVLLDLNKGDKTSLHTKSEDGSTALYAAVCTDDVSIVKLLVEQGANVNEGDSNNKTPLHLAAMREQEGIVDYLLSQGADKTIADSGGYTPYLRVEESYNYGGKSDPALKRMTDKLKP